MASGMRMLEPVDIIVYISGKRSILVQYDLQRDSIKVFTHNLTMHFADQHVDTLV